jgi:hypothetical protein
MFVIMQRSDVPSASRLVTMRRDAVKHTLRLGRNYKIVNANAVKIWFSPLLVPEYWYHGFPELYYSAPLPLTRAPIRPIADHEILFVKMGGIGENTNFQGYWGDFTKKGGYRGK